MNTKNYPLYHLKGWILGYINCISIKRNDYSTSLLLGNMQIKTSVIPYTHIRIGVSLKKKWKIASFGEYVEKLEPLRFAGRNVKWYNYHAEV